MKNRMIVAAAATGLLIMILLVLGLYQKGSYTDINLMQNPLDQFSIGILSGEVMEIAVEVMEKNLSDENFILAVECTGMLNFRFRCASQPVIVKKVFCGHDIFVGDEIEIINATSIFMDEINYMNEKPCINLGFVNTMQPGQLYLVFLEKKLENYNLDDVVYIRSMDYIISPVFCYEEMVSVPCENESDIGNFASYYNVKTNEFFIESQEGIDHLLSLKEKLLKKYPLGR